MIRHWHYLNLGDAMLAGEQIDAIRSLFIRRYREAGKPSDMALYLRHESEGRLHCETVLYMSPACSPVAHELNAVTCPAPTPDGLSLLAGSGEYQFTNLPQ